MKNYYVPGMYYPMWTVGDEAVNWEADTDMGNLSPEEFSTFFPQAVEVSHEQGEQLLERSKARRTNA